MTISLMRAGEEAEVAPLVLALWPDAGGYDFPDAAVFVFRDEAGAAHGFVTMALRPWSPGCASRPCPHIEGWYVAEPYRRRGVGRQLIEACEAWARDRGFVELGSDVRLDNAGSLEAHGRLGFEAVERVEFFRKGL